MLSPKVLRQAAGGANIIAETAVSRGMASRSWFRILQRSAIRSSAWQHTDSVNDPYHHTQAVRTNAQMSNKRPCIRAPVELSHDEWSYINSYLFNDAFDSACDLANMSRVSRTWRENIRWDAWGKAFGLFPLQQGQFPAVLAPIMDYARDLGGLVTRVSAVKHLKISMKNVPHTTLSGSARGVAKHLYKIEDLFRAATEKYTTIQKLEKTMARCQKAVGTRESNLFLKEMRRLQVRTLLRDICVDYFVNDDKAIAYIEGGGSLDEIRAAALACVREKELKEERTRQVHALFCEYAIYLDPSAYNEATFAYVEKGRGFFRSNPRNGTRVEAFGSGLHVRNPVGWCTCTQQEDVVYR